VGREARNVGLNAGRRTESPLLVRGNLIPEAHREPDIVKALQQATASKGIHFKWRHETDAVRNPAVFEVNRYLITLMFGGAIEELGHLRLAQANKQQPILQRVVIEDVGITGGNDSLETVVGKRPRRVLPRGATTEILARHENTGSLVLWLVQDELCIEAAIVVEAPIVESKLAEAGAFNAFEELLRNDLVSIDSSPVHAGDEAGVGSEGGHGGRREQGTGDRNRGNDTESGDRLMVPSRRHPEAGHA